MGCPIYGYIRALGSFPRVLPSTKPHAAPIAWAQGLYGSNYQEPPHVSVCQDFGPLCIIDYDMISGMAPYPNHHTLANSPHPPQVVCS